MNKKEQRNKFIEEHQALEEKYGFFITGAIQFHPEPDPITNAPRSFSIIPIVRDSADWEEDNDEYVIIN